jgi:hypothetical protein
MESQVQKARSETSETKHSRRLRALTLCPSLRAGMVRRLDSSLNACYAGVNAVDGCTVCDQSLLRGRNSGR